MFQKKFSLCFTLVAIFILSSMAFAEKPQNIPVKGGFALFEGIKYPILPGVKAVELIPEDSVYGKGIHFTLRTKNQKDSEQQAQKIIHFYKAKKINGIVIKEEFKKSGSGQEVFYNSSNDGEKGKNLSIMIAVSKDKINVLLIPR